MAIRLLTLGLRWVAGLHTRGKPYHAQDWNIAKFTEHRFQPEKGELKDVVEGLEAQEPDGLPPVQPLRVPNTQQGRAITFINDSGRLPSGRFRVVQLRYFRKCYTIGKPSQITTYRIRGGAGF